MCMGGKSKSTAPPPPTPATTFQPMPADYSNVSQRKQAVAASTNSQVSGQGTAGLGSELGSTN
jgi:hypothetical protein